MNIHEHQAKEILKKYGATVPDGVYAFNVQDLIEKAKSLKTEKESIEQKIQTLDPSADAEQIAELQEQVKQLQQTLDKVPKTSIFEKLIDSDADFDIEEFQNAIEENGSEFLKKAYDGTSTLQIEAGSETVSINQEDYLQLVKAQQQNEDLQAALKQGFSTEAEREEATAKSIAAAGQYGVKADDETYIKAQAFYSSLGYDMATILSMDEATKNKALELVKDEEKIAKNAEMAQTLKAKSTPFGNQYFGSKRQLRRKQSLMPSLQRHHG